MPPPADRAQDEQMANLLRMRGWKVEPPSTDAQFECGCWLSKVGCQRHPPIFGVMCCPIHLKPYPDGRD